ncbi:E3 ubiquitin-protein ligase TRIM7-like [Varanus komodoensis]|uniref:E3 ubiquitin-protein ligase TRIM7-like n=1 Tax=Varanus komodoensis TaxID=61221 RepID=UPI001CF787E1|nr:E3 ubiquitin-protein ligase TRIM7-like [Varanus komodoensis]
MSESVCCKIANYLDDLTEEEFKKFKMYLQNKEEGYKPFPYSKLENADKMDIARLMVMAYEEAKAVQIMGKILNQINKKDLLAQVRSEMAAYFFQPPKPLTKEEKRGWEKKIYADLHEKFSGTQKKVEVTLDPKTAFPTLILSEDRKSVYLGKKAQTLPDNPKRFNVLPCVLGAEAIDSGTVEWIVEVGKAKGWSIGIVRESINTKGHQYLTVNEGYWLLQLNNGEYMASSTPSNTIILWKSPQRIRVHLEFLFGILSFYDADSMEHIFTFNYPFSERVLPFFEVWDTEIPLKICSVDS